MSNSQFIVLIVIILMDYLVTNRLGYRIAKLEEKTKEMEWEILRK